MHVERKVESFRGQVSERIVLQTEYLCLPKMYMLKPNPQYDGSKRWDLQEVIRS